MVSDAAATKAPIAKIADKVSGVFVPAVICIAVVTFIVWMLVGQTFGYALARGISVLVISCPCALVISIPLSFFAGIGGASHEGVLIKGSNYLEALSDAKIVVFDKTGTLTYATPRVAMIETFGDREESEMLRLAACLEEHYPHSMANAVVAEAKDRGLSHEEYHSRVEYVLSLIHI